MSTTPASPVPSPFELICTVCGRLTLSEDPPDGSARVAGRLFCVACGAHNLLHES